MERKHFRLVSPAPVTTTLPMKLKIAHGFGSVAFGVKDTGFSVFLLIFYNQVLGMEAALVSLALVIALLIDGLVDPFIGNLSDRTYTRFGRRLPWLYIAPLPLAIVWSILWQPPVDGPPSFWGLLSLAVAVRLLLSACEVPSVALVPELTRDYDERTTLFRYRYLFGWAGGLTMIFLAYQVFLTDGLLDREGYATFGMVGAAVMVVSVVGSALGQHKLVANCPETTSPPFSLKTAFGEIFEAFSERAFMILAAGAVAAYVSQGMTFALSNYLYFYVWELTPTHFIFYPVVLFASVVLVFLTVGAVQRRFGKPRTAAIATIAAMCLWLVPYGLRLAGFWPEVGTDMSTALLFVFVFVSNAAGVMVMICGSSMVADIVEAFEERTGRRAEGSFYSGHWFVQKFAGGGGIFIAGVIISLSALPDGATPGLVEDGVITSIILQYCAMTVILGLFAAYWLSRFPIDREQHEARLKAMDARGVPGVHGAHAPAPPKNPDG